MGAPGLVLEAELDVVDRVGRALRDGSWREAERGKVLVGGKEAGAVD